jgi:hypothetical protein
MGDSHYVEPILLTNKQKKIENFFLLPAAFGSKEARFEKTDFFLAVGPNICDYFLR